MQDQKYGFIYIWHNKHNNKFYIGCHWGTEDDGYVCSSAPMRKAYRRNPEYFKRRIIGRVYESRQALLDLEHKWLQLIPDENLGDRYYNMSKRHFGHWSATPNAKTIAQKSGETRRGKPLGPCSEETKQKISAAKKRKKFTEEHKAALKAARVGMRLSETHRQRISEGLKRSVRYSSAYEAGVGSDCE